MTGFLIGGMICCFRKNLKTCCLAVPFPTQSHSPPDRPTTIFGHTTSCCVLLAVATNSICCISDCVAITPGHISWHRTESRWRGQSQARDNMNDDQKSGLGRKMETALTWAAILYLLAWLGVR